MRSRSKFSLAVSALLAILERDMVVTGREFVVFLLQALMQPLFFLFIFGKVLPNIGLAAGNFVALMLPGIVALTTLLAAMQGVTLPLVLDLGIRPRDRRPFAGPAPGLAGGNRKGAVRHRPRRHRGRGNFPLGRWILGKNYAVRSDPYPCLICGMLILTACAAAGIGLVMGTIVKPEQISLMFTLIFTPLLFTGCTYYPWGALGTIRWFQIVTLFNPLTYARRVCAMPWCPRSTATPSQRSASRGSC
jgi:ABC-2 type transport system permease protein